VPKATLDQLDNMPDPLMVSDFKLTFANVPGSPGLDIERDVSLNCTQFVIPGITVNKFEQRFAGGHKLNYGATITHAGTAAAQFIERVDASALAWLRPWQEFVRGTRSGSSGGYKKDYSTTGRLEVFDGTGRTAIEITIHNMWPQELPELQFDTTSDAQGALWMVPFSYDWWQVTGQSLG
jgi:hypothetical protein